MKYIVMPVIFVFVVTSLQPLPNRAAVTGEIVVDSVGDEMINDGNCTLREAVEAANTNEAVDGCSAGSLLGRDTIKFDVSSTIFLSSELIVGGGITIQGSGQENTILDGQGKTHIIELGELGRGDIALRDLTIQHGQTQAAVFAINLSHSLIIDRVMLKSNKNEFGGSGLYITNPNLDNDVQVIIRSSTFLNNISPYDSNGGAIVMWCYPSSTGKMVITIEDSQFIGNRGGAIEEQVCNLTISHSLFAMNQASRGGAIVAIGGDVTLINNTLAKNEAEDGGGAVYMRTQSSDAFLQLVFRNNTIVSNSPDNIMFHIWAGDNDSVVAFVDTIIGLNSGPNCTLIDDSGYAPGIASLGHNLTDSDDCGFDKPTDLTVTPLVLSRTLGPLQNNGGPTATIALSPNSPAIDAGNCSGNTVTDDQRGIPRPQGEACDIGAFEYKEGIQAYLPLLLR